jgi:signal transduction histidine kinase
VNLNFNEDELTSLAVQFPAKRLKCIIEWLDSTYTVYNLLNELSLGSGRIFSIVKSLKSYAYLDQAPVQSVSISEGIDDTLMILHNKIKSNISVKRDYAPDLPEIMGYGSRTRKESEWVVVEIEDNGPGIPEDVVSNIFDAFFTTKGPGKGTGLGLNISYSIVVQKHRGDIKVRSKPGSTVFEVWLPINFEG